MKKIMIDMDDVLCKDGFLIMINNFLNTKYTEKDIKGYYIQDLVPEEKREEWSKYFYESNIYENVVEMEDSHKIIKKLQEKYEIYIVTAYIFKDYPGMSANHLKNKFNYLQEKFPDIKPEQYVFTSNKEIIDCDIKIDDRISNLTGKAQLKLLYTAYHNKNITKEELEKEGIIRVKNWKEIEKILM